MRALRITSALLLAAATWNFAATAEERRSGPPVRSMDAPGHVAATALPDGAVPPVNVNGNFIVGPTHKPAPEVKPGDEVPRGRVVEFTMSSEDSKIYPGIAREAGTFGEPSPDNPAELVVTTSHPAPYKRKVSVYVPQQYVPGTKAPFIVGADGPDPMLFDTLDTLIAQARVPVMVAISIANGGGDAQGSQRGLEYDTLSDTYAVFVETEVLPRVEAECGVTLSRDPYSRASMGCSSGAACAFTMAWYRPDLYRRVLSFSGTYVNQQWPYNPETPHGAWGYHERLIPESERKPLRLWLHVGDQDLLNPNCMRDDMHDWVLANHHMARVLAEKGYDYQFVFAQNAKHCDHRVKQQLLPQALEYLWQGHPVPGLVAP